MLWTYLGKAAHNNTDLSTPNTAGYDHYLLLLFVTTINCDCLYGGQVSRF